MEVIPDMVLFLAIKETVPLKSTCRSMLIHVQRRYVQFLLDHASDLTMPKTRRWKIVVRTYARLEKEISSMMSGQIYVLDFMQRLLGAIINDLEKNVDNAPWKKQGNKKQRLLSSCDAEADKRNYIWRKDVGSEVIRTINLLENEKWCCFSGSVCVCKRMIIKRINKMITYLPRECTPVLRSVRRDINEIMMFKSRFILEMNERSYELRKVIKKYFDIIERAKENFCDREDPARIPEFPSP